MLLHIATYTLIQSIVVDCLLAMYSWKKIYEFTEKEFCDSTTTAGGGIANDHSAP